MNITGIGFMGRTSSISIGRDRMTGVFLNRGLVN